MFLVISLIPFTVFLSLAFVVYYFSQKKEHKILNSVGKYLAMWVVLVSLLFPIMGIVATVKGHCPMQMMKHAMHENSEGDMLTYSDHNSCQNIKEEISDKINK